MKVPILAIIVLFLSFSLIGQETLNLSVKIDKVINESMSAFEIPGISLAVVRGDKILHRENYGNANIEHSVPVTDQSIFRVYSITKIFISTLVFKYIEEGKLSLEDTLGQFPLDLPNEWRDRKIKHLLSHSTGFPDMAPIPEYQNLTEQQSWRKVTAIPLSFNAGEVYDYNQTNFYLLQKIIESISKSPISEALIEHQFHDVENGAFISCDSRQIVKNRVTPYFPFETGKQIITHPYLQGDYFAACNGMNITMNEFINWDRKLNDQSLLQLETKNNMLEQFRYGQSKKKFTHGWDKRVLNGHVSYGFSGSLVTAYRIFPDDGFSIILLGNGMGQFFDIEDIVNDIAKLVNPDIINLEKELSDNLISLVNQSKIEEYKRRFLDAKRDNRYEDVSFEGLCNSIGYHLLRRKQNDDAIKVFKLNTELFPLSWNVFDSLGEAYMINGNKEMAIKNYQRSLVLNPNNEYGKEALLNLEGK